MVCDKMETLLSSHPMNQFPPLKSQVKSLSLFHFEALWISFVILKTFSCVTDAKIPPQVNKAPYEVDLNIPNNVVSAIRSKRSESGLGQGKIIFLPEIHQTRTAENRRNQLALGANQKKLWHMQEGRSFQPVEKRLSSQSTGLEEPLGAQLVNLLILRSADNTLSSFDRRVLFANFVEYLISSAKKEFGDTQSEAFRNAVNFESKKNPDLQVFINSRIGPWYDKYARGSTNYRQELMNFVEINDTHYSQCIANHCMEGLVNTLIAFTISEIQKDSNLSELQGLIDKSRLLDSQPLLPGNFYALAKHVNKRWRDQNMVLNILKMVGESNSVGQTIYVQIGASHVPPVAQFVRSALVQLKRSDILIEVDVDFFKKCIDEVHSEPYLNMVLEEVIRVNEELKR